MTVFPTSIAPSGVTSARGLSASQANVAGLPHALAANWPAASARITIPER